jgi:hypothetical protein
MMIMIGRLTCSRWQVYSSFQVIIVTTATEGNQPVMERKIPPNFVLPYNNNPSNFTQFRTIDNSSTQTTQVKIIAKFH